MNAHISNTHTFICIISFIDKLKKNVCKIGPFKKKKRQYGQIEMSFMAKYELNNKRKHVKVWKKITFIAPLMTNLIKAHFKKGLERDYWFSRPDLLNIRPSLTGKYPYFKSLVFY